MRNSFSASEKAKKFETLLTRLNVLESSGFSLDETKHVTSKGAAGESYEYLFGSCHGISIEFTYYTAFEKKSDYVIVSIIDDKSGKDFSLDSWLQSIGIKHQLSPFKFSSYAGGFNEQAIAFLDFVCELLVKPELKPVLDGRAWVDVSFAWGDIK